MDVMRTVKKCVFKNGCVLRMMITLDGVWFIFLETPLGYIKWTGSSIEKELLWNGLELSEANVQFENFKWNPLINDGGNNEN